MAARRPAWATWTGLTSRSGRPTRRRLRSTAVTWTVSRKWSPASWTASMAHSTQVSAPSRTGPDGDGDQGTPANLSAPVVPNLLASSCCPSASTLAQKCPARSITGQVAEVRLGQNSTSGGASDSAAKAWQANPARGGPHVVMTVTPVQKCPRTCRNSSAWGGKAVAPQADRGALPADPGGVVDEPTVGAVLDVEPAGGAHVEGHHQVVGVPPQRARNVCTAPDAPV